MSNSISGVQSCLLTRNKSPKKSARDAASQTAKEYGEASSLHGIQYIFERGQSLLLSRLFWLLVVIAGVCVGVFWSVEVSVTARPHAMYLRGLPYMTSQWVGEGVPKKQTKGTKSADL